MSQVVSFTVYNVSYINLIYNIRFQGPKIWNSIDIKIKTSSLAVLKKNLKSCYIDSYQYIAASCTYVKHYACFVCPFADTT